MKLPSFRLSAAIVFFFLFACKKDNTDTTPANPTTGSMIGRVVLTDEFGHVHSSCAGMLVTASDGTHTFSASTDSTGRWDITGMSTGTYNLSYSKSGYGTFMRFGYPVDASISGTTTVSPTDTLGEKSTTLVSALAAVPDSTGQGLDITCNLSPVPTALLPRSIRIFFGHDSLVSYTAFTYRPDSTWSAVASPGIIAGFSVQLLLANGFNHHDTAYVVAYGESRRTNSYYNPLTLQKVFPNLNASFPSNRSMFILP